MKKGTTIVCTALMIMGAFLIINWIPEVSATTWTVGPGQQFATIGEALNTASDGDIIQVQASNYNEHLTINKAISLVGVMSGSTRPKITGPNSNNPIINIPINNKKITIANFEIDGCGTNTVAGIRSSADPGEEYGIEIDNCVIHDFVTTGCGIKLHSGANFHWIHDCDIYDNVHGMYIESGQDQIGNENILVERCEVYDNSVNGIYNHGDYNWFIDNYLHHNEYGIKLYYSDLCWISSSYDDITDISYNDYGIYASYSEDLVIIGSGDNLVEVHNNTYTGIWWEYCDDSQITLTRSNNNGQGMHAKYTDDVIMDHVYIYNNMWLEYCNYWAISYYSIPSSTLDNCTNINFYP